VCVCAHMQKCAWGVCCCGGDLLVFDLDGLVLFCLLWHRCDACFLCIHHIEQSNLHVFACIYILTKHKYEYEMSLQHTCAHTRKRHIMACISDRHNPSAHLTGTSEPLPKPLPIRAKPARGIFNFWASNYHSVRGVRIGQRLLNVLLSLTSRRRKRRWGWGFWTSPHSPDPTHR